MGAVHVIKPGILTTVQDLGRWGFQSRGVPVAGAMDLYSHRVANALVGNSQDAATLEATLLGPELEFDDRCVVAVSGAEFELTIDAAPVTINVRLDVGRGSRLRFGRRLRGARAYVAVGGGIDTLPVLGSRATHVISQMGGLDGRVLRTGDRLPVGAVVRSAADVARRVRAERASACLAEARRRLPRSGARGFSGAEGDAERNRGFTPEATRIRVLAGPQDDLFDEDALGVLQSAPYIVGPKSDRMGFRLEGPVLAHVKDADIISDATPLGALQVPASGLPILLMADRQTTGGYPKIATVIAADIGVAGQLGPGDAVSFAVCTPREAMAALIAQERLLMALEGPRAAADGA